MRNIGNRARILAFLLLIVVLLTLLTYALGNQPSTEPDALTAEERAWLASRVELRVAGDQDFPPFEFVDQGEYRGYNVDLMRTLELELGIPIRLIPMPWSEARAALERGEVDAIQGMKRTAEREAIYGFSTLHLISSQALFVTRDRLDIQRIGDLAGHRVGIQAGDFADEYLAANAPAGTEIIRSRSPNGALGLLMDGHVDAIMVNRYVGLYLIQKSHSQDRFKIVGDPIEPAEYCMVTRRQDQQLLRYLDKGLKAVEASGRKAQINRRWFGEPVGADSAATQIPQQIAWWGTILFVFLLIVLMITYVWSWSLRRQVMARTHQLQDERDFIQALFQTMGDGLVVLDADGHFEMGNRAFYDLIGYSQEELHGRERFWSKPAQNDSPPPPSTDENQLPTESISQHYECRLVHKNGRFIDALVSESMRYSPDGSPQGCIAVYTDITALKKMGEEIRHSLQVQQSLLETAIALQGTLDDEGILHIIADQMERLIPHDSLSFYIVNWEQGMMVPVLARGEHAQAVLADHFPVGSGVMGQIAIKGEAEIVPDMAQDPRAVHIPGTPMDPETMLAVPLVTKEIVLGLLAIYRTTGCVFQPEELELARIFANQAVSALENTRLYAREQQRAAESLMLLDVAQAINSTLDLDLIQVLKVVTQRAAQACEVHRCTIMLLEERGHIKPLMSQLASGEQDLVMWHRFKEEIHLTSVDQIPLLAELIRQRQSRTFLDAELATLPKNWIEPYGIKGLLALPLVSQDQVLGLMLLDYTDETRSFSKEQMHLAQTIAGQVAVAIENARLYTQVQHRAAQLQTAAEVSRRASGILEPGELLQQTVDLVHDRFDLCYVGIFLVDQTGTWTGEPDKWAVLCAGTGEAGTQMLNQGHKLVIGGDSMVGLCITSQQARIALNVGEEVRHFKNPLLPTTRSELALPLISRGQVIGAMTVQSDREETFTEVDIATLQTMADQVANAIENARLYARVQRDIEELRKLDELKSDFVAVVSHELRTPLTSVIAYSETLLQGRVGDLAPQQQRFMEVIRQSAYEQLRIVDDLLDLSRLETGRMTLHLETISLPPIVDKVLHTATPLARAKDQYLANQVPADLPMICADPDRVRQIVLNLVSNGIKFTPSGGHITITAEVMPPDEIKVAVHDTGIGIAPEHQRMIFEKFTQVEKPLTRQYRGIGLGLPITRVLLELHGGRIWVESTPGRGSTFYFTLPMASPASQ